MFHIGIRPMIVVAILAIATQVWKELTAVVEPVDPDRLGVVTLLTLDSNATRHGFGYASGVLALGSSLISNAGLPGMRRICMMDEGALKTYGQYLNTTGWEIYPVTTIRCLQEEPEKVAVTEEIDNDDTMDRFRNTCTKLHFFKIAKKLASEFDALLYLDSDSLNVGKLGSLFQEWGQSNNKFAGIGMRPDRLGNGNFSSHTMMLGKGILNRMEMEPNFKVWDLAFDVANSTVSPDGGDQGIINNLLTILPHDLPVRELPDSVGVPVGRKGSNPVLLYEFSGHGLLKPWQQDVKHWHQSTWKLFLEIEESDPRVRIAKLWSAYCMKGVKNITAGFDEETQKQHAMLDFVVMRNDLPPVLCGRSM